MNQTAFIKTRVSIHASLVMLIMSLLNLRPFYLLMNIVHSIRQHFEHIHFVHEVEMLTRLSVIADGRRVVHNLYAVEI